MLSVARGRAVGWWGSLPVNSFSLCDQQAKQIPLPHKCLTSVRFAEYTELSPLSPFPSVDLLKLAWFY